MSTEIRTHKDLDVWKDSMSLAKDVYQVTNELPTEEKYGLSSQMRRAAISVPSNIAEGAARSLKREFAQFLYVALGSFSELETQWLLANDMDMVKRPPSKDIEKVRMRLLGLIRNVKKETNGQ